MLGFVYATPLVMLDNMSPVESIKASYSAGFKNVLSLLVFRCRLSPASYRCFNPAWPGIPDTDTRFNSGIVLQLQINISLNLKLDFHHYRHIVVIHFLLV